MDTATRLLILGGLISSLFLGCAQRSEEQVLNANSTPPNGSVQPPTAGQIAPRCDMVRLSGVNADTTVQYRLNIQGNYTSATINGFNALDPSTQIPIAVNVLPNIEGRYIVQGVVNNNSESGSCSDEFVPTANPSPNPALNPPTCTIARASGVHDDGHVAFRISQISGNYTAATINGANALGLNNSLAEVAVFPNANGIYVASGLVTGPGGSNPCTTSYNPVSSGSGNSGAAPTCTLVKNSTISFYGQSVAFGINATNATSLFINDVAVSSAGALVPPDPRDGVYRPVGRAVGPGGSVTCTLEFVPPSCFMSLNRLSRDLVEFQVQLFGDVASASLDGVAFGLPTPPNNITTASRTPVALGPQTSTVRVSNSNGDTTACAYHYIVPSTIGGSSANSSLLVGAIVSVLVDGRSSVSLQSSHMEISTSGWHPPESLQILAIYADGTRRVEFNRNLIFNHYNEVGTRRINHDFSKYLNLGSATWVSHSELGFADRNSIVTPVRTDYSNAAYRVSKSSTASELFFEMNDSTATNRTFYQVGMCRNGYHSVCGF